MDSEIAVYILTHNRPYTIIRSLSSVQKQSFRDIKIIVSDNSDNDKTEKLVLEVSKKDTRIEYVHRTEVVCQSGIGHINYILKHNKYEYFIMFHDDDEMLPEMVQLLYSRMLGDTSLAAVGCNSFFNINGKLTKHKTCSITSPLKMYSPEEVIKYYICRNIVPFPSYMYRSSLIKHSDGLVKEHGGKYSDSSFIVDLTKVGTLEMLPDCGMIYFVSSNQDSYAHNYSQYLSLINYWANTYSCKKQLLQARIYNIYNSLKVSQREDGFVPFKKEIFKLFLKCSPTNFFLKYIFLLLKK